jgi:hypothetical protein
VLWLTLKLLQGARKGSFVFYDDLTTDPQFVVPPSERLRLRRESLRSILMPDTDIPWSKSFSHATRTETGQVIAYFEDETTSPPGSIVTECDGTHSRVRKFLKGDTAACKQLPIRCLEGTVVFPTSAAKAMRNLDPLFMQNGRQNARCFCLLRLS